MLGPARPFTVTHVITNVRTLDRSVILNYGYGFHVTIRLRGLTLYSDVPYPRLSARCQHSCFEPPPVLFLYVLTQPGVYPPQKQLISKQSCDDVLELMF